MNASQNESCKKIVSVSEVESIVAIGVYMCVRIVYLYSYKTCDLHPELHFTAAFH